jgi:hypothetical protein
MAGVPTTITDAKLHRSLQKKSSVRYQSAGEDVKRAAPR